MSADPRPTGIVLCGGRGTRVANADKPLLDYAGRPLVQWVVDALLPQVQALMISANRNIADYNRYGEVVVDTEPDFPGPLAGIVSCLRRVDTPAVFICPGDCPHLADDLVATLANALGGADCAVAHDGARQQHLHMVLKTSTLAALESYLNGADRSVRGWTATLNTVVVDCSHLQESFRNINAPEDFT